LAGPTTTGLPGTAGLRATADGGARSLPAVAAALPEIRPGRRGNHADHTARHPATDRLGRRACRLLLRNRRGRILRATGRCGSSQLANDHRNRRHGGHD
jgi:hypothetical protein